MALASNILPTNSSSGPDTPDADAWDSPNNALACDSVYTVSGPLTLVIFQTAILAAESYDLTAINNSGILTGIEVHIEALIDQGNANFTEVYLRRNNARTGINKADTPVALATSETDHQFGADGDLWSSSYRTVGDFLGSGNGIEIRITRTDGSDPTASIDCITLTCYFTNSRPFIMRFGLSPRRATLPINRNQRSRI